MPYFLIANALILISVLSGILVNSNIHWISRHHVKVISLNMGLLLAFTVIELIPSAIDISHKGLIFVVIGILLPNFFHHHSHHHNSDMESTQSLKFLFIGAAVHSFFDGLIITSGLFLEHHMATVITSSMLLHKVTEVLMLSLILGTILKNSLKLMKYLIALSFFSILGMVVAAFFIEQTGLFSAISGIAVSLTAGIFLSISLVNISILVEHSQERSSKLYPLIGTIIYLPLHVFLH